MLTWGASALRAEEEDRRAQRHFVQQQRAGQQAHREAEGGGRGAGGGRTSGYACLVEAVPTRSRGCVRARRPARKSRLYMSTGGSQEIGLLVAGSLYV